MFVVVRLWPYWIAKAVVKKVNVGEPPCEPAYAGPPTLQTQGIPPLAR